MKGDRFVILDVNGVAYKIFVLPEILRESKKDSEISLWTHLYVRENVMELYGFKEYPELEFFETLIQIPGIGPKSGLGILALAPLDTLKRAISVGDTSYLTKVSGIGKKVAEKIVVELKEKLGGLDLSADKDPVLKEEGDVLEALQSLGYPLKDAREALKQIPPDIKGTNNRLKEALKILGSQ